MSRAKRALAAFLAAARELDAAWADELNQGYPQGLDSFDEVVRDLEAWCEQQGLGISGTLSPAPRPGEVIASQPVIAALSPATVGRLQRFCIGDGGSGGGHVEIRYGCGSWSITAGRHIPVGSGELECGPMAGNLRVEADVMREITITAASKGTSPAALDTAVNAALDGVALAIQKWRM